MGIKNYIYGFCFLIAALHSACEKKIEQNIKLPVTFEVTFDNFDGGTPENPIAYSRDQQEVTFSVRAVDLDDQTASWYEGEVEVSLAPRGKLAMGQAKTLKLNGGVAQNVTVAVQKLHGQTAVWVEDKGAKENPGSFAVGLSPNIYVADPFLSDLQYTDATGTSPLKGDFVQINLDERQAVVTGVTRDGFYLTDVTDPEDAFNAVYVYTHSLPDGVDTGVTILSLSGTVQEYFGFTELGFPSYEVGETVAVPPAVQLTTELVANDLEMEKRESRLVTVSGGTVCPLGIDFDRYGQWAINLEPGKSCSQSGALVNVVSTYTVEWFNPRDYVGKTIKSVTGNLRQHTSASPMWMVYTRDNKDIIIE